MKNLIRIFFISLFMSFSLFGQLKLYSEVSYILSLPWNNKADIVELIQTFDALLHDGVYKNNYNSIALKSLQSRIERKTKQNDFKRQTFVKWMDQYEDDNVAKMSNDYIIAKNEVELLDKLDKFLKDSIEGTLTKYKILEDEQQKINKITSDKLRVSKFQKFQTLKKGACIKVAHSNFNIEQKLLNGILDDTYKDNGYWYQAKVLEVRKTSIIVEIQLEIGGKGGMIDFGDEEVDYRKTKWKKGQFVEIEDSQFIKKCY